ncbi:MAG: hypothetical protein V7713_11370, partial [Marinobacter sp.]
MSKTGQVRVLTPEQFAHLLSVIQEHRYPEMNTALVQGCVRKKACHCSRPSKPDWRPTSAKCRKA